MKSIISAKLFRSIFMLVYILILVGLKIFLPGVTDKSNEICYNHVAYRLAALILTVFVPVILFTYCGAARSI